MKKSHLQAGVGHYGIFNGSKWRQNILPVVRGFIREYGHPEESGAHTDEVLTTAVGISFSSVPQTFQGRKTATGQKR